MPKRMTYAQAGVDIDKKSRSISALVEHLKFKREGLGAPIDLPGHFTGLIDFGDYALTLCTDGVGTKLLVADAMRKWDTIGIDCIAMNVNDTICVGSEPIGFVDYIAIERPDRKVTSEVGKGLERGAEMSNMTIVGGEIAVLPELVKGFDLAGTCLGMVKKDEIITGDAIKPGDALIGLPSSGIHSNGLTLARRIFESNHIGYKENVKGLKRSVGMELLEPTTIYVRQVLKLIDRFDVEGMANITGGGLRNLIRLKKGIGFEIEDPMRPNPIFDVMQELGNVADSEMYQTFNMGMGYCMVVRERESSDVVKAAGKGAKVVGHAVRSNRVTVPGLGLKYSKY
ncbi:MAG: phosphoribosylformylglycinamidine cyclo-ligase [Thermoplasmatota archaeon]|nr:phosphoribosylformylglycinamidine cyclo-ligase [Candidatus Thermoplasmatota archaeon]MBU1914069.1 phosphoribosylformylglycinamidine cyclo-ligase [Candidatus Thermoplasmatota archaeon]